MIKNFVWTILLAVGLEKADGFALLGPRGNGGDNWQTIVIGYGLPYEAFILPGGPVYLGDIGGPKNIGEEYRRNVKTLYYAYDQNFSGFFGLDGEAAADGAFAIMNSLTNVDSYSAALTEFPLQSQHINNVAASLFLTDIKSVTLHLLVEQMGLAQPERFTWTLHNRFLPAGGKCPFDETYIVVQRNFDITPSPVNQVQYSPYVNDVLYTYGIVEICTPPPATLAEAVPFAVDPLAEQYTAVAANDFDTFGGLQIGGYYSGLTRDDVGGLRYLIRTNNINLENTVAGSLLETTNFGGTITLTTSNLSDLLLSAQTNDPALLPALFPGLVVATTTNNFTAVCTPNVSVVFASPVGSPAGSPQISTFVTNGSTCVSLEIFTDTFANVITNRNFTNNPAIILDKAGFHLNYSTTTPAKIVTVSFTVPVGSPAGTQPVRTAKTNNITLNVPSGEYFLIPPGQCGWEIISILLTNVVKTTNVIATAIDANGFVSSMSVVTTFTNHTFVVRPITCVETPNVRGEYQGVGRVQFVRVPDTQVDPLTGNFLTPITNSYTMVVFNPTNSQLSTQTFHRIVTRPDILLSANDQANGPGGNLFIGTVVRNINFDQGTVLPGLAGPGVINSPSTFSYNKVGSVFWNVIGFADTNSFILPSVVNELTQIPAIAWASFDGSTNDPEVYPNGASIQNLENQLVVNIAPTSLPDAANNAFYNVAFSATGGVPPYTWSIGSGTQLPSGLTFSSGGVLSGTPSGNPPGTYDFIIELTDSQGRVVDLDYSLTIN